MINQQNLTALQKAEHYREFWLQSFYRTGLRGAFNQMLRYHNRIAELRGIA